MKHCRICDTRLQPYQKKFCSLKHAGEAQSRIAKRAKEIKRLHEPYKFKQERSVERRCWKLYWKWRVGTKNLTQDEIAIAKYYDYLLKEKTLEI